MINFTNSAFWDSVKVLSVSRVAFNSVIDFSKIIGEFKDNLTALMDLEIGGVDAVVMDIVVGSYSIKTSGKDFVVLPESR